jgi:hypothetical protein
MNVTVSLIHFLSYSPICNESTLSGTYCTIFRFSLFSVHSFNLMELLLWHIGPLLGNDSKVSSYITAAAALCDTSAGYVRL